MTNRVQTGHNYCKKTVGTRAGGNNPQLSAPWSVSAVILHATLCIACWAVGLELLIGGGAGLCSLVVDLVCAHWWWSWSVLTDGAGLCSLVVELVSAH